MSSASGASPARPAPKQIRFVNNEGQPPAKRRRINAACRTCRKRKTRCDGKRPLCTTCTENGHQCLGYAEVGEIKRERKGSDALLNGQDDEYDYHERGGSDVLPQPDHRAVPRGHAQSSPDRRRSEPVSYNEMEMKSGRAGAVKGIAATMGDYRDATVFSDEGPSSLGMMIPPLTGGEVQKADGRGIDESPRLPMHNNSHRVPYFRYFGPTAIVPGFKQMVVSVREHRRSTGAASSIASSIPGGTPSQATESRSSIDMPIYDQNDPLPVNRLIIHLVELFFAHLGCNYPFLSQKSFTQRVEERSIEAILVDAICALAARFSDHPLLTAGRDSSYPKSEYGHIFAQRAKAAVVDTFPCPTVAAVQACLLLAYEGFGANQDSALWMYLGCAIRMAVDLGLQKLDGVRHQGQKDPGYHRSINSSDPPDDSTTISEQEKLEIEQERIDTLWAVFILDRVISSGTGRPVTLRDVDFELTFPTISTNSKDGWPKPFPALIQIIHLYGRVSDLLNNIRNVNDVTQKVIDGLAGLERDLTHLYQRLDPRLNFNAPNFQHYVKAGEGTNFILVHFWFHTLIMLLHQPTLMHSFEGPIQQLLPNSRELSMSSAKTIADILAFAEIIDPRSFIGNPFTSQPMYIAACAFLMESAAHTASSPTSRDVSPPLKEKEKEKEKEKKPNGEKSREQKQKHSLLASAANQNYQVCYKALQQLEMYWGGTRYILVALDQKAKGIWDPETYTEQEYESTKIKHDMIPSWRRKISLTAPSPSGRLSGLVRSPQLDAIPSNIDPSQAIGWSLTGTTNSPSSNLTFMYQNMNGDQIMNPPAPPPGPGNMIYDPIRQSLPEPTSGSTSTSAYHARYQGFPPPQRQSSHPMLPPGPKYPPLNPDSATTSDAEMLLELQNSPFPHTPSSHHQYDTSHNMSSPSAARQGSAGNSYDFSQNTNMYPAAPSTYLGAGGVPDMMMQSQEIDMSSLTEEMMPWLEYIPQEYFDGGNSTGISPNG